MAASRKSVKGVKVKDLKPSKAGTVKGGKLRNK
jgi:hypothetical protein